MNAEPMKRVLLIMMLIFSVAAPCSWSASARGGDALPSWNDGQAKQAIARFVERVTKDGSPDFVPVSERIAVFDNDGTLWAEQPLYFQALFIFDRIKQLATQHPEWNEKEPFVSVLKGDLKSALAGGEHALIEMAMATHAGTTTEEFEQIVREWITTAKHPKSKRPFTEMVYQPMLELLDYLRAHGFKTFIVSGGGIEFMRVFSEQVYGVPPEQVIGSSIRTKYEVREGKPVLRRLPEMNFIDDKAGKPVGIQMHIGRRPLAAFGNSDGDFQMIEWTTCGPGPRLGLIVHHNDADREWAYDRKSSIGRLDRGLDEAGNRGWLVVSMKEDWKQVFAFDKTGGGALSSASGLTGVTWLLMEVSGHPVAAFPQGEHPFILFDREKNQATGYAGCNRFFGGYQLDGGALKFGPIGATKRACPDHEEGIETAFFKVLDATRGWRIVDGTLELMNGDRVLARLQKMP
ncbi:META domain-containing protein [Petrachloros mirabilis]